jgi:AcrR family transcriptional regulator
MQRPDEKKRQLIADTAAKLFATRPYHEVRLDDVAAAANVGKGTLYIYFESKEDLYFSLIHEGFAAVVERLKAQADNENETSRDALARIVGEMVGFAKQHPYLFELMRSGAAQEAVKRCPTREARKAELLKVIEQTIRRGVRRGELCDKHPELTAVCITSMIRGLFEFGPKNLEADNITAHVMGLLQNGIAQRNAP